jgi:glyoxylase-like metal-dependent hydrolase (beta-lactamase superfamily II)
LKVTLFKKNPKVYSCNAYLICGDWNALDDVNTLIDTGTDDFIYEELQNLSTGLGKRRIEQIILTHEHFDHSGGLDFFIKQYNPTVIALSQSLAITQKAYDGQQVKVGDRDAQIFLTPGHSSDSICIYVPQEKTLFSGDTPLFIKSSGGTYTRDYVTALERLLKLDIQTIYSGHDYPIIGNAQDMLIFTYNNVLKSIIV